MNFLNKIPNRIISRGANYYLEDRVKDLHQSGYGAYSSIVEGSEDYKVTIDVNHPTWSICTCPHYNDGNICKHIVATYFAIIDDENLAKEYAYKEDDYYDDYYEDDEEYEEEYEETFNPSIFFEKNLDSFITSLSESEAKNILRKELIRSEKYTTNKYLKDFVNSNAEEILLDKLYNITNSYSYLLRSDRNINESEQNLLEKMYQEKYYRNELDKLFYNDDVFNSELYLCLLNLKINDMKKKDALEEYDRLTKKLDYLKKSHIKESYPKSMCLIGMDILNHAFQVRKFNKIDTIITNCKYEEYLEYMINTYDKEKLLKDVLIELTIGNYYINRKVVPFLSKIIEHIKDKELLMESLYYIVLYSEDIEMYEYLKSFEGYEYYRDLLLSNAKAMHLLEKIYCIEHMPYELMDMFLKNKYDYKIIQYLDFFKETHNDFMLDYFKNTFIEKVKDATNRSEYEDVCKYVRAISRLDDNKDILSYLSNHLNNNYPKKYVLKEIFEKSY